MCTYYCVRALAVAYGHIGITAAVAGHFTYFVIFAEYGFFPNLLFGSRVVWENPAINDMPDSYGQEWTCAQRTWVNAVVYTGFFMTIVMCQWANLISCKTRRNSIITQGMK